MTRWVEPWVAHPVRLCAVRGCPRARHLERRRVFGEMRDYVRRWCSGHVKMREQEITGPARVLSITGGV